MARYNTSSASTTITGSHTISSPSQGAFVNLAGTAPYTVTLPSPALFPGSNQTFYNTTSGTITLSTPSGTFTGTGASGTSTNSVFTGNVLSITSDGTNYVVISEDGSPLVATTGSFSSDVTITGASATVNIQPASLILYPGSSGAMDRVNIGVNTRGSGAFTSLAANGQVSFTANTSSTSTSTGSLVVTGGIGVTGNIWSGATVNASSVVATSLTGTLQTAAQTNITSVGILTSLTSSGTIKAQGGRTTLRDDSIENHVTDNDTAGIAVNYYGFESGTTRFRDFNVYNGKASLSLKVTGSTGNVTVNSNLGINTTPSTRLDISGDSIQNIGTARITNTRSGGSYYPGLIVANNNGDHSYGTVADFRINGANATDRPAILFSTGYNGNNWAVGMGVHTAGVDNFSIGYRGTYPLGAWATAYLTINTSGNIGIGQTSPTAPLSFANSVGNKIDLYHTTGGAGDRYGFQVQSSELRIHSGNGGDAAGGITLGRSNTSTFTEAMRVRNDTTITIGNSAISGGAVTSNTYTHFERMNSPQTVTRTNWGKSSNMEVNQYRGAPNYNMPFVMYIETPANEANSANTYYPVSFNTPGHGGGQFGNMVISRRYYDTGPAQRGGSSIGWNDSSTHQGGLEAWFHVGESAWSDYYSARLLYYRYTYHTTVSDYGMMLTSDSRFGSGPFWVRLRGGFAYWIHASFPISPANVTPGGTVFYYPTEGNTYQTWPGTVTSVQNTNFNSNQYWGTL